jgi:hypothetical protein
MVVLNDIVFFDISSIIAMIIVASLSKSIGEALNIRPYYKFLYFTSGCIAIAAILDTVPFEISNISIKTVSMTLRCIAGIIALPLCFKYWGWLFPEFFKN